MSNLMNKEEMEKEQEWADACYECTGYGDDWYFDQAGQLVSACKDCWVAKEREEADKRTV